MIHPNLMMAPAPARVEDLRRSSGPPVPTETTVTLRLAVPIEDDEVIGRVAALDDSTLSAAPMLLALAAGEPRAALSLTDGKLEPTRSIARREGPR